MNGASGGRTDVLMSRLRHRRPDSVSRGALSSPQSADGIEQMADLTDGRWQMTFSGRHLAGIQAILNAFAIR